MVLKRPACRLILERCEMRGSSERGGAWHWSRMTVVLLALFVFGGCGDGTRPQKSSGEALPADQDPALQPDATETEQPE